MGRQAKGLLYRRVSDGVWCARVPAGTDPATGKRRRERFDLGTQDEGKAARLLRELLAQRGKVQTSAPRTVAEYAAEWLDRRKREGVKMAQSEAGYLSHHVIPVIGAKLLGDVGPRDVRLVIERAREAGLSRQTIAHIRGTMARLFKAARADELTDRDPVEAVTIPKDAKRDQRPRVILSDAEVMALWAADVDLEIRLMSLVARAQGGLRTRELVAWDWADVDVPRFRYCTVPRAKGGARQKLEIPALLQAPLRRWWLAHGEPVDGPVFPVTRGPRKGERRGDRNVSFAARLRRALRAAGIERAELFEDTERSRKVDFHSFRRAAATALVSAGLSTREARAVTGHRSDSAFERYVMPAAAPQRIPTAALPGGGNGPAMDRGAERSALALLVCARHAL